jgi:hypothetical protein
MKIGMEVGTEEGQMEDEIEKVRMEDEFGMEVGTEDGQKAAIGNEVGTAIGMEDEIGMEIAIGSLGIEITTEVAEVPTERRVMPRSNQACKAASARSSGFASKVISSQAVVPQVARIATIKRPNWAALSKEGVPPPK